MMELQTEHGTSLGTESGSSIAIVGGGIAGLYCAWKLLASGRCQVTLFEMLDRLGGRIETERDLEGFTAEFGPMRFEPEIQPLFKDLCTRLKIELVPFPPPTSPAVEDFYPGLAPDELDASRKPLAALKLLELGVFRMFGQDPRTSEGESWFRGLDLVPRHRPDKWIHPLDNDLKKGWSAEDIREKTIPTARFRLEGTRWRDLGFWNALSEVLSHQAVLRIRDTGAFYHLIPDNPNAVEWAIFWLRLLQLRLFQSTTENKVYLHTIRSGVRTIVDELEMYFRSKGFTPLLRHRVKAILPGSGSGRLRLRVENETAEFRREFDHVILALPKTALVKLSAPFPEDVRVEKLDSVMAFPLLKAFVVVNEPWWRHEKLPQGTTHTVAKLIREGKIPIMSHRNAGNVPTRELHYFLRKKSRKSTGMVMLYTDRPATEYWKPLVPMDREGVHEKAAIHKTGEDYNQLKGALVHYLAFDRGRAQGLAVDSLAQRQLKSEADVWKKVTAYAIRDWSYEPFGAGCHAWKPGVKSSAVRRRLAAFALERMDPAIHNVHICGEAYSDYQGFIEGALQSAMDVLKTIPLAQTARRML